MVRTGGSSGGPRAGIEQGLRLVQMFVLDEELAVWEAQLAHLQGAARLELLAQLAWHLRQRDPARARSLAPKPRRWLAQLPDAERRRLEARFMLVEGEANGCSASSMPRARWPTRPCSAFDALGDAAGSADAPLAARLDRSRPRQLGRQRPGAGRRRRRRPARRRPRCGSTCSTPPPRCSRCFATCTTAEARWGKRFDADAEGLHPAARGWIDDYAGTTPSRPAISAAPSAC